MKSSIIFILLMFLGFSPQVFSSYGKTSANSTIKFTGKIEVFQDLSDKEVDQEIHKQIDHLIGTFQSKSFIKKFKYKGTLGDIRKYTIVKRVSSLEFDTDIITYNFIGNAIFDKRAFGRKRRIQLPIKLPLNLEDAYFLGFSEGNDKNLCTDDHYNGIEDFFYFWDPEKEGCPLKGNNTDVYRVNAVLERKSNHKRIYPKYDKLFGDNGNGNETRIDLYFGYVDHHSPKSITDYLKQVGRLSDLNSEASLEGVDGTITGAYDVGNYLEENGFTFIQVDGEKEKERLGSVSKIKFSFKDPETKVKSQINTEIRVGQLFGLSDDDEIKQLKNIGINLASVPSNSQGNGVSELRTYVKEYPSGKKVVVNIFITDTGRKDNEEHGNTFFKNALKDSLMNADVIEYEGHSGLGENLDIKALYGDEVITNPNKYQVIFINGCNSYTYFRKMYLEFKGNEENIDLILAGLTTMSDDATSNSIAFIKNFINPEKKRKGSFQAILNGIEKSNDQENGTYLTSYFGLRE